MLIKKCSCKNPGFVTIQKEKAEKDLSFADIIDGQDIRVISTKSGISVFCAHCEKRLL